MSAPSQPHLRHTGAHPQLIVEGRPLLMRAGELHNSSSTSRAYMGPVWDKLQRMGLNTVLAAVPWDLIEPEEGQFDFTLVDELIKDARAHNMRLVPLWFGSWKNGLSHYAPLWVKKDTARFPRLRTALGNLELVSPFSKEAEKADTRAFAAMMAHIKKVDQQHQTVVMVQVQNEVGVSGDTRDRSAMAEALFNAQVPAPLMQYLSANKDNLLPETTAFLAAAGNRTSGTWREVFGLMADEVFMGWAYSTFCNTMAVAGKAAYDIPLFVNAALTYPHPTGEGEWPTGGPVNHMQDIWRAGAPAIDMLCPDIYQLDFEGIIAGYQRSGNPLFVPEGWAGEEGAANAYYTIGQGGMGYASFAVEKRNVDPDNGPMAKGFALIAQVEDQILDHQAKGTISSGRVTAKKPIHQFNFGGYRWTMELLHYWRDLTTPIREHGYAIIMQTGPDEFLLAGTGCQIRFNAPDQLDTVVGIGSLDEGHFEDGRWVRGRRVSGDEIMNSYQFRNLLPFNNTGTYVKFWGEDAKLLKLQLYTYQK